MAYRLIFRFDRADYLESVRADIDREVKITLQQKLDQKSIKASRIYAPSRNSIKVIFLSEDELNPAMVRSNSSSCSGGGGRHSS